MSEKRFIPHIDAATLSPEGVRVHAGRLDGEGLTFGIAVSRFNDTLTSQLVRSAVDCLAAHGTERTSIEIAWVPGAYEIPLVLQQMAVRGTFDALIGQGAVIEGDTPHADLITRSVTESLAAISLAHGIPVIDGVVATRNEEQAVTRCRYGEGSRGWYAGLAALETATVLASVRSS